MNPSMRWRATVAYDGTDLNGWQSQPDGNTVQDFLEQRLAVIFGQPIRIHGSGRTDAGVHARGQVCHWDGGWAHSQKNLRRALQTGLPQSILVRNVEQVSDSFHARYSVWGKRYIYYLYEGRALPTETRYTWSLHRSLNIEAMRLAASQLTGVHDFSAFSVKQIKDHASSPIKDLRRLDVIKRDRQIRIVAEADGFLYKMVRSLVGGLVEVGIGRESPESLAELLVNKRRGNHIATAPARGLFLDRVFYPNYSPHPSP